MGLKNVDKLGRDKLKFLRSTVQENWSLRNLKVRPFFIKILYYDKLIE
jgi:hypothetical protein